MSSSQIKSRSVLPSNYINRNIILLMAERALVHIVANIIVYGIHAFQKRNTLSKFLYSYSATDAPPV